MELYQIKDRLLKYLETRHMSVYRLEKTCGFSKSYFKNMDFNVPETKLDVILQALPDLNREWLLNGTGEMTNGSKAPVSRFASRQDKNALRKHLRQIYHRVITLCEMNGKAVWEVEEDLELNEGTLSNIFSVGDERSINSWLDTLLQKFPSISSDWLRYGEGPAKIKERRFIPVVDSPRWLKDIVNRIADFESEKAIKGHDKETDQKQSLHLQDIRALADLPYVSSGDFPNAEFAIRASQGTMFPTINVGDIVLCQYIDDIPSEQNAITLIELTRKTETTVVIGYASRKENVYAIKTNSSLYPIEVKRNDVISIAKAIGIIRSL